MSAWECLYNGILHTAGLAALGYARRQAGGDDVFWQGRLGKYPPFPPSAGAPRIWLQAASVGEVNGALPVMEAIGENWPSSALFLTVGTPQGFRHALHRLQGTARVLPFPLDFPLCIRRALGSIQPHLYVSFESEFWPNLLAMLHRRNVPTMVLNGRLSRRSARAYRFLGPLFRPVFRNFRRMAMLSEEDRRNAASSGAPVERTVVTGSTKYDALAARARPEMESRWRGLLALEPSSPVVVGGSLRGRECVQVPEVFASLSKDCPSLTGVFAPRHLKRVPETARKLRALSLPFHYLSDLEKGEARREKPAVLVDRMGALFDLYSLGDLIFCGGTLEPVGGHNILEPAAWSKPVFFGPRTEKVSKEKEILLKRGGGFQVRDARQLLELWRSWLPRLEDLRSRGRCARAALEETGGAGAAQVELIREVLDEAGAHRRSSLRGSPSKRR